VVLQHRVVAAGDEYRELAQNDLGEMTLASPAVSGNALFIRTEENLYKVAEADVASSAR
jgi:hypothetical protein